MTEISDVYNAFVNRMVAIFPNHHRLTNSFDLTQNNEQFLAQGWGMLFGPAENTARSVSKILSVRRSVTVHLTRRVVARELDPTGKADADKALLEDFQILIDAIEENFTLETGKYIILYVDDSGITPVHTEKERYIAISANITAEYQRLL